MDTLAPKTRGCQFSTEAEHLKYYSRWFGLINDQNDLNQVDFDQVDLDQVDFDQVDLDQVDRDQVGFDQDDFDQVDLG